MIRVADYISGFLSEHGVKDVFMLSGGGILHLTDGLVCNKNINIVCLHHEQAVSMAAEAYGKTTGNLGVGYFTTGPGATNAITGLAGAWLDSVPCLFISGQVGTRDLISRTGVSGMRQVGVQEINILPIVQSITKYGALVDRPEEIRYHLEKAYHLAKEGRPGPVWLDIPGDIQSALVDPEKLEGFSREKAGREILPGAIEAVSGYLEAARRPVIVAGHGVRLGNAILELSEFAAGHAIPVVTTFLGIDVIDGESPVYVGRMGIKGDRAGNLAVQNSDLVIVIGSSMPIAQTSSQYYNFAREAKVVVVDIDATAHLKKTIRIDLLIEGDAREFLRKMMIRNPCPAEKYGPWLKRCITWKTRYPVCLPEYRARQGCVDMYHFVDALSSRLGSKDAVITDAGSAFYVGSQAVRIKDGMRYITSGGFATMGYSLPASIGVCLALEKNRVMCITGDGSFQQNIQELQSVLHYGLPIKIFVLNNDGYLSIRSSQQKYFNRFIGESPASGVSFPDTEKISGAYGIRFFRIADARELDAILDGVLKYDGPAVCEVMTPRNQPIVPTIEAVKNKEGMLIGRPLEDMYPFLDRDEYQSNMIVRTID